MNNAQVKRIFKSFGNTPIEFILYGFFSIISISSYSILSDGVKDLFGLDILQNVVYCYTLTTWILLVFGNDWFSNSKLVKSAIKYILGQLMLLVIVGIFGLLLDFYYPGYIVNPLKVVLWVIIPIMWIVLLSSSRIKRFAERFNNSEELDYKVTTFFDYNIFNKDKYKLPKFNRSNLYKYCIFFSTVIIIMGALFSIQHWKGAMFIIVLGFIFIIASPFLAKKS